MIKYTIIFLWTFFIFACNKQVSHNQERSYIKDSILSEIAFSKKTIEFGAVSNDTNLVAAFYIKNIGAEKLIIKEVSPECGCTEYILENDTVSTCDSTKLTVKLHTYQKSSGLHRTAVIIASNTPKEYNTLFIRYIIKK